jgi:hypothetical protein
MKSLVAKLDCRAARVAAWRIGFPRLVATVMVLSIAAPSQFANARVHSTDPLDWMIQHVCVDMTHHPVAADPYFGCPAGATERRLKVDDLMPYLRHDQPGSNGDHPDGFQRHDAYPIRDLRYGGIVVANDFDFDYREPYGQMHPGDGDGYDVYRVARGWVTAGDTRDGSGYSASFFGADCKPFGGWNFFPTSFLASLQSHANGKAVIPIRGSYWEQNGAPWPGSCTPGEGFSTDTLTTWEFEPSVAFSGFNGSPVKRLDAIISTHGMPAEGSKQNNYHLERFYFTDMYGITRWEAWTPVSASKPAGGNCAGATQMSVEGVQFTRTACRDWSVATVFDTPRPRLPWPYPESNLLQNFHFDGTSMEPWQRTDVKSDQGNIINWSTFNSINQADRLYSHAKAGVRYLVINCGGRVCSPGEAIFQDIPVSRLPKSASYDYGFSALTEGGSPGAIKVELLQLDVSGHPLSSTSFVAQMSPGNFRPDEQSIYRNVTVQLRTSPIISLVPAGVTLRFRVSPQTAANYLFLDAWLIPR